MKTIKYKQTGCQTVINKKGNRLTVCYGPTPFLYFKLLRILWKTEEEK